MGFVGSINSFLNKVFGIEIIRVMPRGALKFAVKYFGDKKIIAVEIGVLYGNNSKEMLKRLNIKKFYLIDPYEKYADYRTDSDYYNLKKAEKVSKNKLKKYFKKLVWVKDFSERGLKKIKEKVDFIYIDGNHEYGYVKKDLRLSWRILKIKGVLSGHDIQSSGVSKAVFDFAKEKNLDVFLGEKRDWWIIKK